jgi:hypothetical protein
MKTGTGRMGREILDAVDEDMLDAREASAELRVLRQRIPQVPALSKKERKAIWQRGDVSVPVTQASINIITANETVAQTLKIPAEEIRSMLLEANSWDGFIVELRGLLEGVSDANLIRRERIAILTAQAYNIARELVRDPEHDELREHVDGIRRLKRLGRRRKRAAATAEGAAEAASTEVEE